MNSDFTKRNSKFTINKKINFVGSLKKNQPMYATPQNKYTNLKYSDNIIINRELFIDLEWLRNIFVLCNIENKNILTSKILSDSDYLCRSFRNSVDEFTGNFESCSRLTTVETNY